MTNTLIVVGVLVVLVIAALAAYRMTISSGARRRDIARQREYTRLARNSLHQITQKINAWRPSLDEVGIGFANDVAEIIVEHDAQVYKLEDISGN